jgi:hypothetical protein
LFPRGSQPDALTRAAAWASLSGLKPGSLTLTEPRLAADAGAAKAAMATLTSPRIAIRRSSMELASEKAVQM